MAIIIGVRFREVGRVYYFDPGKIEVKKGERVIVETARGVECGEVVQENTDVPEEQIKKPLKQVIRIATEEDLRNLENKTKKEAEAFKICEEKIAKHQLDMKLVSVEYTFDASKIIFHFTADQRVDFRALVRDLAGQFRTRIELRQIGVRDEAKLLGGLGVCGRAFCCSSFMGDFHPVSIKMAKEQGLSLNPTKISGTCGRLMCCLKYEEAAYEDALKELPKPGSFIDTPDGRGMVTEVNAVSRAVKVKLERRPDVAPQTFQYNAIEGLKRKAALREDSLLDFSAPEEPAPKERPAPQPRQQHPKKQRDKEAAGEKQERQGQGERREKNWRERHSPRKPEAEPRQQQRQQAAPQKQKAAQKQQAQQRQQPQQRQPKPPKQKAPLPAAQTDVKSVPRYGEVRRANAPQQPRQQPGGANYHRQPWQKQEPPRQKKGEQKQGQKRSGKKEQNDDQD